MPSKKSPEPADPDSLKRQPDGVYRTGDGRFSVEQGNGSWFLADHEMADDFGQPRVIGPFATLKDARVAIPRLRSEPIPLRKPIKQAKAKPKAEPPPKPETWLDRLDADDRKRAQRMVRALEKEGLADADEVAEASFSGAADPSALPQRILRARLDRLGDEAGDEGRATIDAVVELLSADGSRTGRDLPGWALVALEPDGSVTDRRLEP
jgi:hypothetical protein